MSEARPLVRGVPMLLSGVGRLFANGSLAIGLTMVVAVVLVAAFAPLLAPHDPFFANPIERYLPPLSEGYLLGTDELGRDILSRLIYGARLALLVAVVPTVIALVIGGAIGLFAGYLGGAWDSVVMRVFDVMFAFPGILLALGVSAALGPGLNSMIIAMVVVTIPAFGRIIRGVVLGVKEELYVEAARALGYGNMRIALRHVLPNVLAPALVYGTLQTGRNVILAASLSFLGLGPQPPTPDWGQMLSGGRMALATAAHVATIPGLAIVFLAIGFNLLGDGARDLLDPRTRRDRL
ncbi:ABC transporter permease [Aquibium sp. A9E412]|uniref:ABC transporter permease n=1 Tax=Aquibium sp. A9E412 TaxID=2976767 RepID=UPI0025B17BDC|nr:ABC transporter permease [Aquibium sp. A9E412]MDN2565077.1 ABC transporter permease [Aquibium sp. A9E412]